MKRRDGNGLWSNCVQDEILTLILSRLTGRDYFVFRAVCKRWGSIGSPNRPSLPSPCLMTLCRESGSIELFHPLYNLVTRKTNFPELKGCRIRCARKGWLLMSQGDRGMFFFNPISKGKIQLPDLAEEENYFPAWTFSSPLDDLSADCFVVGFDLCGPPVYIIKVGDTKWSYHSFGVEDRGRRPFPLSGCNNPVFLESNTTVHVFGDAGNLGILSIKGNSATEKSTWQVYGKPLSSRKRKSIQQIFTAEDNSGGLFVVFLTRGEGKIELWRYKMKGSVLEKEQITSLGNQTLFVSYGTSYLKPCNAPGLENKIYLPMFHDNDKAIFYCLATQKYYSFDYPNNRLFSSSNYYKLVQPRSCIWIEPDVLT